MKVLIILVINQAIYILYHSMIGIKIINLMIVNLMDATLQLEIALRTLILGMATHINLNDDSYIIF